MSDASRDPTVPTEHIRDANVGDVAPSVPTGCTIGRLTDLAAAGDSARVEAFLDNWPASSIPAILMCEDPNRGGSAVHFCAINGRVELLRHLYQRYGPRLDVRAASSGMTPLHWACTHGHINVSRFLISSGCSIDATDIKQTTPLMVAAQYGHTELLSWLAQEGADIHRIDSDGDTALHWAAYRGNVALLDMLCKLGMSPAVQDHYGSTALHLAAGQSQTRAVAWLMQHAESEAMLTAQDDKGRVPLQVAAYRGSYATRRILEGRHDPPEVDVVPLKGTMHGIANWLYEAKFVAEDSFTTIREAVSAVLESNNHRDEPAPAVAIEMRPAVEDN